MLSDTDTRSEPWKKHLSISDSSRAFSNRLQSKHKACHWHEVSLWVHIPQSVSEAWSNMPLSPSWFSSRTPPRPQPLAPRTEGNGLWGPSLCQSTTGNLRWWNVSAFSPNSTVLLHHIPLVLHIILNICMMAPAETWPWHHKWHQKVDLSC